MSKRPTLLPNPHAAPPPVRPLSHTLGARPVRRRDFLNGLLVGASAAVLGGGLSGCDGGGETTSPGDELPPGKDAGDDNTICHQVRDGQTWSIPAPEGDAYDCVIIGGGISGLVTAYRLGKLGITNVLVLEKEDPPGGYSRLDGPADAPWGQAAAYTVYPYNDNLIEIYTDLDIVTGLDEDDAPVLDPKYVLKLPVNSSFIDGTFYPESWDSGIDGLPYDQQVKDDLKAFKADMITWYEFTGTDGLFGFDTPTDASTADADVRALDLVTFAEYIEQRGWSPKVAEFYAPYCRSAFGSEPSDLSAWAAINFFGSEFQPAMSRPGGNAHLAVALAGKVGASKIQTKCFVIQVKNQGSEEVQVTYLKDGAPKTLRAKTAVYAGPRYLASYVLPDLVAAGRNEAASFKYTPYIVAAVHVSKTPAGMGYDNWIQEPMFFTDIIVADWAGLEDPESAPLDRPNTLSCYCPLLGDGRRSELLSTSFEEYEQRILDDLEKVVPGVRETVTGVDIYRWGHAMLAPGKGFVFGEARVGAQAPEGRIHFACHDVDGLPAFENAVGAAYRATAEVAAALLPPP